MQHMKVDSSVHGANKNVTGTAKTMHICINYLCLENSTFLAIFLWPTHRINFICILIDSSTWHENFSNISWVLKHYSNLKSKNLAKNFYANMPYFHSFGHKYTVYSQISFKELRLWQFHTGWLTITIPTSINLYNYTNVNCPIVCFYSL